MKKFLLLFLFTGQFFTTHAQTTNCAKTCKVEKVVPGGTFLGVNIQSKKTKSDVHVRGIVPGTAAERMGILKGDILVSINGVELQTYKHTQEFVRAQKVGQPVKVVVNRNGKDKTFRGKLGFDQTKTITEDVCCDKLSESLLLKNVAVYPNPSNGVFQLSFDGANNKAYNLSIVDLQGNIVFEQQVNQTGAKVQEQIKTNVPASGEYLLVIDQDGKKFTKSVVFVK